VARTLVVRRFDSASGGVLLGLALAVVALWFVGNQVGGPIGSTSLVLFLASAGIIALYRIQWGIALLLFFSPAHFVLKELSPSILAAVWRELLLLILLFSWATHISAGTLPWLRKDAAHVWVVLLAYLCWALLVILFTTDLLIGMTGFRFVVGLAPVFFIASSAIRKEADIRLYVKVIISSGILVGSIAVLQFFLVSILGVVDHGTGIDFARKYAPHSYRAAGIPWDRSNSILVGPNELGIFMAVSLALTFGYYISEQKRGRPPRILWLGMAVLVAGLLVSMSRTAMISLAISYLAVGVMAGNWFRWLWIAIPVVGVAVLSAPYYFGPLFGPVTSFADPYFTGTLAGVTFGDFLDAPAIWGRGYGSTISSLEVLGRDASSILRLGSVDFFALEAVKQVGWLGFLLSVTVSSLFIRSCYKAWKDAESPLIQGTAVGLLGAFIIVMVGSAHFAAWEYVSFAASFYVLGAIATRLLTIDKRRLSDSTTRSDSGAGGTGRLADQ
jgi:hypothetical protein